MTSLYTQAEENTEDTSLARDPIIIRTSDGQFRLNFGQTNNVVSNAHQISGAFHDYTCTTLVILL